jgi:hypothetical protein
MQITRELSKGQVFCQQFFQANVPASQTDVQLFDGSNQVVGISVPFNGEIVAVVSDLSAAATVGTLTVNITVNGTKNANFVQTISTQSALTLKIPRKKIRVVAGDKVGIRITTGATWNGTTSDLLVSLYVLQEMDGI